MRSYSGRAGRIYSSSGRLEVMNVKDKTARHYQ